MSAVLYPTYSPRLSQAQAILKEHALLLGIVGVHFLIALLLCWKYPAKYQQSLQLPNYLLTLALGVCFALCGFTLYVMVVKRPHQLVRYLRQELRRHLTSERVLFALPVLGMMPLFASSFTVIKAAVPLYQPFAWDARLAYADQVLHGGIQPWLLLQGVLGHPAVTAAINFVYHLWFFIMLGSIYWLAFALELKQLRMQFVLSFVASWILLGNVVALLFSSAGPCYYGHVVGGADPYAPLMSYLHSAAKDYPVWALSVQDMLWKEFSENSGTNALSIAAMPSMHVGTAVLLALMGWRLNRTAGILLTIFAVLIMLGSVHLGWHYALDGYVAALGAVLIWLAVGRLPQVRRLR